MHSFGLDYLYEKNKKRSNKLKLYIVHYHKTQEFGAGKSGESTNVNV